MSEKTMEEEKAKAIRQAHVHARRGDGFMVMLFIDRARQFGPIGKNSLNAIRRKLDLYRRERRSISREAKKRGGGALK